MKMTNKDRGRIEIELNRVIGWALSKQERTPVIHCQMIAAAAFLLLRKNKLCVYDEHLVIRELGGTNCDGVLETICEHADWVYDP